MNRQYRIVQWGMTIIEMMVAMLIGSLLIIAVLLVLAGQANNRPGAEGSRRSTGSGSEMDQAATIAMFQLDKWVRSAGSGLGQTVQSLSATYSYAYGCQLAASKSSTQLLPVPSATTLGPFGTGATFTPSGTAGVFRLMPVLIVPGATSPNVTNAVTTGHTSDALVLMASGNGYGDFPLPLSAATASQLTVLNTTAFSGSSVNDMALLAQTDTGSGIGACMITQAALTGTTDGSATALPLGGSWYQATINGQSVTSYGASGVVLDLGDPSSTSTQPPSFQVVGVGDNDTLYSYDLLAVRSPQLQSRGENVFELHALYGVDTNNDGKVDTWVSPSSGSYTVANLTAGTVTASALIKTIKAVRVGLIMRTDLPEKNPVAASSSVTLFQPLIDANSGLSGLLYTRTMTGAELNYRYRTIEATIPVRNNSL